MSKPSESAGERYKLHLHLPKRKTNKGMSRPNLAPYSNDLLFAISEGATPRQPEFSVCISILARIHSAGILFQHIAISQAICLLPQGPLSIECVLWSQQEITSSSSVSVYRLENLSQQLGFCNALNQTQ